MTELSFFAFLAVCGLWFLLYSILFFSWKQLEADCVLINTFIFHLFNRLWYFIYNYLGKVIIISVRLGKFLSSQTDGKGQMTGQTDEIISASLMSVRCNTNSVGVSCPEAEEHTGHGGTQHVHRLNPSILSHTFLSNFFFSSVHKSHIGFVWLQKMSSPKRALRDLMWKSVQLKMFWHFLDKYILLRLNWKAEFSTHKMKKPLTTTRCALYLTDHFTCIKKTTVIFFKTGHCESLR